MFGLKKWCALLLLLFSYSASSLNFSQMKKLNFSIDPGQKIYSVQIMDSLVVVSHSAGIAISQDHGANFFVPNFSEPLRANNAHIFIDPKTKRILLNGGRIFLSNDQGANFQRLNLGVGAESVKPIFDGNTIYLAVDYGYHEICDTNVLFISHNGGRSFTQSLVGHNECNSISDLLLVQNRLYVLVSPWTTELYISEDQGKTFQQISENDQNWTKELNFRQSRLNLFGQKLAKLSIPPAAASTRWDSSFHIEYANKYFNPEQPTPDIGYKYGANYIDSGLVPRSGGLSYGSNAFYFSSFNEIWVE